MHPFEPEAADVAISDTGCMPFGDPVAAFTNIGQGLRAGGRLALLTWRELEGIDEAGRAQALDDLRIAFKQAETADGVLLGSAAWLITATRA